MLHNVYLHDVDRRHCTERAEKHARRRYNVLLFLGLLLALRPSVAFGTELEICQRAKALGYDESRELRKFSSELERCTMRFWSLFLPKPLNEILSAAQKAEYDQAIEDGNCGRATELLSSSFDSAHPNAPPHLANEYSEFYWGVHTTEHYLELSLCRSLRSINLALEQISTAGITARPFWSMRENYYGAQEKFPPPVRSLYSVVAELLNQLNRTDEPTIALSLLRLSVEGRAIKFNPNYELYIALRLRDLGVRDPLIQEIISRPIDSVLRNRILAMARLRNSNGIPMFPE